MSDSFVFRRARAADETAVRALSALIWGGEDYAGDSFHEWLADEQGQFTVVYDGETLVAFGKLSRLSPGEWWLEGLARSSRPPGARPGPAAARLCPGTGRRNGQRHAPLLHRLDHPGHPSSGETTGLPAPRCACGPAWSGRKAPAPVEPLASFVPVERGELTAVTTQLSQSDQFAACGGLLEHDWKLWLILPRLEKLQAEQRLFWWLGVANRLGLVIRTLTERSASLSYFQADPADWSHLLDDARRWLLATGAAEIRTKPPKSATMQAALLAAGWTVDEEFELWGYERPLPGT
jgi:hypothetical protein